jgi:hypothetical protein
MKIFAMKKLVPRSSILFMEQEELNILVFSINRMASEDQMSMMEPARYARATAIGASEMVKTTDISFYG